MKAKPETEELLVMYLLGELPEEDQARLEEVFFIDDLYFEQLLVAEDELRYDYAQGLLDPGRRGRFEKRFAASPGDLNRLDFATALASTLLEAGGEPPSLERPSVALRFMEASASLVRACRRRLKVWERLTHIARAVARFTATSAQLLKAGRERLRAWDRLTGIPRVIAPAKAMPRAPVAALRRRLGASGRLARIALASAAIVLLAGLAVIISETLRYQNQVRELKRELNREKGFRYQTEEQRRRARELADEVEGELEIERSRRLMLEEQSGKQSRQTGEKVEGTGVLASFILSPGLTADSGAMKKVIQTGEAARLRLQLHLKKAGEYQSYEALIKTAEGKLVSGQAGLHPARLGPIQVVALTLPTKIVPPGDYHVELKGIAAGRQAEQVDDYYVTVAKRE